MKKGTAPRRNRGEPKNTTGRKVCFVIAPIGDPDSETRKRSDQILQHVIRPAVEEIGYQAIRADEIDRPGLITSQVIQQIVSAPLVVADLTGTNPNVFYELALRHALRLPLVQLIQKGEAVPFDVAGTRTISVDHHDLDSAATAKDEIIRQVHALEQDPTDVETPISAALDLQVLRQSSNPEERSLADVVTAISEVRSAVTGIEANLKRGDGAATLGQLGRKLDEVTRLQKELRDPQAFSKSPRISPPAIHRLIQAVSRGSRDPIGILIVASALRDVLPWLHELGMDAYRKSRWNFQGAGAKALHDFRMRLIQAVESPECKEQLWMAGEDPEVIRELYMMIRDQLEPRGKHLLDDPLGTSW
jgi:hypothetical protein